DPLRSEGIGQGSRGLGLLAGDVQRERQGERREEDEDDADGNEPSQAKHVADDPDHESRDHQRHVGADGVREDPGDRHPLIIIASMAANPEPGSVAEVRESLGEVGYLADEPAALVAYLAQRLGKPVLVEGPAGVGKTELAKAISRATQRQLIRLQCYEGLDEAKALYEWNYRKQLLRIQTEADATGWQDVKDDIFGEEFLLSRPLLSAIAA